MGRGEAELTNGAVGFWYAVLAIIFAVAVMSLLFSVAKRRQLALPVWDIVPFIFGALAFFIGCGLHHATITDSLSSGDYIRRNGELYVSIDGGSHMFFMWLQFVGAPLACLSGIDIVRRFRNRLRDEA